MNNSTHIRVAVASDQAIFLRGLSTLVLSFSEASLVGEARSLVETLQLCQLTRPELLLLGFLNLTQNACQAVAELRQKWPAIQVAVLADFAEGAPQLAEMKELGCYRISPNVSEEELRTALKQICEERPQWLAGAGAAPAAHFGHEPEEEGWDSLASEPGLASLRNEAVRSRELVMAGRIQEDILPEVPKIDGWDISARLKPARETSGDFYDFIPLTEHKMGVVVADVTDKGMGAALFMALSSTLLRTYAVRFPTLPGLVLNAVSERLLKDTRGGMFVTTIYGILEPYTGRFVFANAGHPPACLISRRHGRISVDRLQPTGMALGVSEEAQWRQKVVKMSPGDFLVLFTDGITEANNALGTFFGDERLVDALLSRVGRSALEIRDGLLEELLRFTNQAPAQDDIAIIVIRRQE